MAVINIKRLSPSEPNSLYSDLDYAIRNAMKGTTAKVERGNHVLFLLGGLHVKNLNDSGLSEETIGRLLAALESENVTYALLPEDQRNGYLPLILTKQTRAYIENDLPELINNDRVKWYIYELNSRIDPDDNERAGSTLVVDENDTPITLKYSEITPYFDEHGFIAESGTEDDLFDEDIVETERMNQVEEEKPKEKDPYLDLGVAVEEHQFIEKEEDNENKELSELQEMEELFGNSNSDEDVKEVQDESISKTSSDLFDEGIESEDKLSEGLKDDTLDNNTDAIDDSEMSELQNPYVMMSDDANQSQKLPEGLQRVLDSIKLPKFSEYKGTHLYPKSTEILKSTVSDMNSMIEGMEYDIKQDITNEYFTLMSDAFESTMRELDVETGADVVRERYQSLLDREIEIENELQTKANDELQKLRDDFFGPQFQAYVDEWMATARQRFEEEYYAERVVLPHESIKEELARVSDEKKVEARTEYYDWRDNVKEVSIGTDQVKIVEMLSKKVSQKIEEKRPHIKELQSQILEIKRDLIAHETTAIATDNMREHVNNVFNIDEKVQMFKSERDDALAEVAKLTATLESELKRIEAEKQRLQEEKDLNKEFLEQEKERIINMKSEMDATPIVKIIEKEIQSASSTPVSNTNGSQQAKVVDTASVSNSKHKGLDYTKAGLAGLTALLLGFGTWFGIENLNDDNKTDTPTENVAKTKDNKALDNVSASTPSGNVTMNYSDKKPGDTVRVMYGGGIQEFKFDHIDKKAGLVYVKDYNNNMFVVPLPKQ